MKNGNRTRVRLGPAAYAGAVTVGAPISLSGQSVGRITAKSVEGGSVVAEVEITDPGARDWLATHAAPDISVGYVAPRPVPAWAFYGVLFVVSLLAGVGIGFAWRYLLPLACR